MQRGEEATLQLNITITSHHHHHYLQNEDSDEGGDDEDYLRDQSETASSRVMVVCRVILWIQRERESIDRQAISNGHLICAGQQWPSVSKVEK